MKNFQVKHSQCDSVILPQNICFCICSKLLLNVFLAIHKFIVEFHALQCLSVRASNKNKGRVGLFHISQKERLFHLLWQPSTLWGNLIMRPSSCIHKQKAFYPISVWARREYAWTLNWNENLLPYFKNCQDVPYSLE